jgi:beta-glucosidase/6-phospho-beta-glucosidase/beta-galactosidase
VPAFSFSISWPRIFPFGKGPINEEGVQHYDDVIAELVEQEFKIAPVLFHWDTPLALFNEYGAWSDRQIVDDFFDYATFIIQRYDHLVDEWFVSSPFLLQRDVMLGHTLLKTVWSLPLEVSLLMNARRSTNLSIATGSTHTIPSGLTFRSTTMSHKD